MHHHISAANNSQIQKQISHGKSRKEPGALVLACLAGEPQAEPPHRGAAPETRWSQGSLRLTPGAKAGRLHHVPPSHEWLLHNLALSLVYSCRLQGLGFCDLISATFDGGYLS